jgi:hypothetical protein
MCEAMSHRRPAEDVREDSTSLCHEHRDEQACVRMRHVASAIARAIHVNATGLHRTRPEKSARKGTARRRCKVLCQRRRNHAARKSRNLRRDLPDSSPRSGNTYNINDLVADRAGFKPGVRFRGSMSRKRRPYWRWQSAQRTLIARTCSRTAGGTRGHAERRKTVAARWRAGEQFHAPRAREKATKRSAILLDNGGKQSVTVGPGRPHRPS